MGQSTRTLILGGVFFLIPLLLIIVFIEKALQILLPLVVKLVNVFNIHSIFGAATITIFSIVLLLAICFLSGLILKMGLISDWNTKMEDKLFLLFPSMQMLKYKFSPESVSGTTSNEKGWRAIMLKEDHHYLIAFITTTSAEGYLSIYIPDAPKMDAGEIRFILEKDCDFYPISMKTAMKSLSSFGRDINLDELVSDGPIIPK